MHAYWSLHTTCCASGHFITEPCLLVAPYHMLCLVTSSPCHAYWSLHMPCLLVLPYCHMPCLLVATYHLAMPTDRGSTSGVACSARILTLELMYVSPCFSSHIQALHYSNSNVHQATKIYRCSIFLLLAGTNDLRFGCSTGIFKFRIIPTFRICVLRLTYCFVAGFAFVYFEDERDAEDAIHDLHDRPFGYSKRRLSVEWSRQGERGGPRHRDGSRAMANIRPTKTLFVINFDPIRTRTRDIERHFEPYGKVLNVRIRRNFAFVQFETQEEATKALECTNMSKILDRVVSVEYALRDDGERGESPRRGGYGRRGDSPSGRSVSPVNRRGRPSPDYGRARSPVYDRYNGPPSYERERSPDYGRYPRSRSPVRRSHT